MAFKIKDRDRLLAAENPVFMSTSDRAWFFIEHHRAAIFWGLGLFLLVSFLLGGLVWHNYSQNQQAMALQHEATSLYLDRPLDEPDTSQQNLERAITLFQQILEQFPASPSAELAQYFLGNARVEQQQYPEAIQAYQFFIQNHRDNPILLGLVYQRLGSAYMLNNEKDNALEAFSKVLNMAGAINKDQVLFELAKLEETSNSPETALSYYKRLVDEFPFSPYAGEAALQVKALEPKPDSPSPTSEHTPPGNDPEQASETTQPGKNE